MTLTRMWINQPSILQPLHQLHGTNVLAGIIQGDSSYRTWFLDGETISMDIPAICLSVGWLNKENSHGI